MTAHDFTLTALDHTPLPLAPFAGRPLLLVNTASLCGFTGQYAALQRLYEEYGPRGLTVVAIPSNDFGGQEPGNPGATCARFKVAFPVAEKAHVKGPEAIPLFQWLATQAGALGRPRWNFYKYVIAPDGSLARWFSSITKPDARPLRATIERLF